MRKFPLITTMFIGLALSLSIAACDGGDDGSDGVAETGTGDGDPGDGDGDPGTGDGDGDAECFTQPPVCEQFVRCIAALVPTQADIVEQQYGAEGSCWCGSTNEEAQACYETCGAEVAKAIATNPTESQCHESVCPIEELDPDQPYGPIVGGSCADYVGPQGDMLPQEPFMSPFGLPGGFCAPKCSGLANYCPGHTQTAAEGTCYLGSADPNVNYCASRCYVDPEFHGGHQCACGAICQPHGSQDGEGQLRGLCTFE